MSSDFAWCLVILKCKKRNSIEFSVHCIRNHMILICFYLVTFLWSLDKNISSIFLHCKVVIFLIVISLLGALHLKLQALQVWAKLINQGSTLLSPIKHLVLDVPQANEISVCKVGIIIVRGPSPLALPSQTSGLSTWQSFPSFPILRISQTLGLILHCCYQSLHLWM